MDGLNRFARSPIASMLFLIIVLGIAIYFYLEYSKQLNKVPQLPSGSLPIVTSVNYACAENKKIQANYSKERVQLVLSDGRTMTFKQVMSGSGARYASADESIVFWNKGKTAFIAENNQTTYADCNQAQ